MGIVAERCGVSHFNAGARQIDRGFERVSAAGHRKAAIAAAAHLKHHFADGDYALLIVGHRRLPAHSTPRIRGEDGPRALIWQRSSSPQIRISSDCEALSNAGVV